MLLVGGPKLHDGSCLLWPPVIGDLDRDLSVDDLYYIGFCEYNGS